MIRRGRGWRGDVNAALHAHEEAQRTAADILTAEHGIRHLHGSRTDLCRHCIKTVNPLTKLPHG